LSDDLSSLADLVGADSEQQLGELVILVEGDRCDPDQRGGAEQQRILGILAEALPLKQAVELTVRITGGNRNQLYKQALRARES